MIWRTLILLLSLSASAGCTVTPSGRVVVLPDGRMLKAGIQCDEYEGTLIRCRYDHGHVQLTTGAVWEMLHDVEACREPR